MDISDSVLAILPARSRQKFDRLAAERQAAVDAYRAAVDREQEARRDLMLLEGRVRQQLDLPQGVEVDIHPAGAVVAAARQERQRAETEHRLMAPVEAARRRLQLALDARERAAERQNAFAFLNGVSAWLDRMAGFGRVRLAHAAPPAPKKDLAAEVARLRGEIGRLDADWAAAEAAPAPIADLRARFLAELDAIAARGEPSVAATARGVSPVDLARRLRIATQPVFGGDGSITTALSGDGGAAFFVWLLRDEIASRIGKLIDAAPQAGALTDAERDARFAEISARRLELERLEEACIVAAEAEGRVIARRREADPRAILEVRET